MAYNETPIERKTMYKDWYEKKAEQFEVKANSDLLNADLYLAVARSYRMLSKTWPW